MTRAAPILDCTPKEARVRAEVRFGARVQSWLHQAGSNVTQVAEHVLGVRRNDLYEVFAGEHHFRAAWLELLPPAVELLYLAERAAHHALQLAPIAEHESTMSEAIQHFGAALTTCGMSEADGFVDVEEATRDLVALRALNRKVEELIRHRERALLERGLSVVVGGKR